jgi:multidrug efflux system outer membrane protein
MFNKKSRTLRAAVTVGVLIMGGCAVSPDGIDREELQRMLQQDQAVIDRIQVPVTAPMTLSDIMARAVLTNLDQRVNNLQEALALGAFELARYDMLPSAALSSTYYDRNNENAARSISVLTRQQSLEPSTSQEPQHNVADLRLSWNLLDFGVSYFQAKQEADRYMVATVNRQKALIDLLQEARGAYWRALAAQRLREPVANVIEEALAAYNEINQGIEQQVYPSMVEALQMKKELFALIGDLRLLQSELEQAMIMLANFINAPSSANIVLVDTEELPSLPAIDASVETLEQVALLNSSEVLEEAYNARIEQAETRKALLRLLPGIELGYTGNYDSNRYLYNNDWNEASVRVSWNLLRLASTRQTLKNADLRDELQLQRRLAANMAVVTRLNLSLHQYASRINSLETASELQSIDDQIAQYTSNAVASNSSARLNLVRTQAEALTTTLSYLRSYADVQEAYGAVLVSLGLNPLPEDYNSRTVEDLSAMLGRTNEQWLRGTLPLSQVDGATPAEQASTLAPADVPVIAVEPSPEMAPEEDVDTQLQRTIAAWLDSWSRQDIDAYFAHYLDLLSPAVDLPRDDWRAARIAGISTPAWIDLGYRDFEVVSVDGDAATVRVHVDYREPNRSEQTVKELRLSRVVDSWLIVMERDVDSTASPEVVARR